MRIVIRNPAPADHRQENWGDYHFGRSLTKYLERYGAYVTAEYQPEWGRTDERPDALIVLRGKFRSRPLPGCVNVLWCVSHPGTLAAEECEQYDAVCVGSARHAAMLQQVLSIPVLPLLQCTDDEEFHRVVEPEQRRHVVFVGNTRNVRRPCVDWAVEYGLPLRIYGRGWDDVGHGQWVVSDYVRNEDLPELYAGARVTLNDHWNDMREYGYINNRIFDALASGLPVVSDSFEDLRGLCRDGILYYEDRESFAAIVRQVLLEYPLVAQRASALWSQLGEAFTFSSRARFLLSLIEDLRSGRSRRSPTPGARAGTAAGSAAAPAPFAIARVEAIEEVLRLTPGRRFCPMCGTVAESFAPDQDGQRGSAPCGRCGALARHRLWWLYFVNVLWPRLPSRMKRILDVAPEKPIATLLSMHPGISYLSGAPRSVDAMVKLDAAALDLPDRRFDVLLGSPGVDDVQAMCEMHRVIRPRGYAIVPVPPGSTIIGEELPVAPGESRPGDGQELDHLGQDPQALAGRLRGVGFSVVVQQPVRGLSARLRDALGLRDEAILECQRPVD